MAKTIETGILAIVLLPTVFGTVCQDNVTQCAAGDATCCELVTGQFGCCPIPDAVCCPDLQHCCPEGFSCIHGLCTRGNHRCGPNVTCEHQLVQDIICPGGTYKCPDRTTCCQLPSEEWGCCPLPNAVCCPDKVHCCPHGYTCGPSGCQQLGTLDVICPGGTYKCPDMTTCCQLPSGKWGCCPLPNAVCCPDKVHCCPSGYSCSGNVCVQIDGNQSTTVPWRTKEDHAIKISD